MDILTAQNGQIRLYDACNIAYMNLRPNEIIDKSISYTSHNLIPEAEQESEVMEIKLYKKSLAVMLDERACIDDRLSEALDILEVVNIFEC